MASSSQKKIIYENKRIITNLCKGEIISILGLCFLLIFKKFTKICVLYLILEFSIIFLLYHLSKEKKINNKRMAGSDLNEKGIMNLLFDFVYICWAAKLLCLFFRWILLFQILLFAICIIMEYKRTMNIR